MTLTRRRVSPKVRSTRLVWRILLWCSAGNRRYAVSAWRSVSRHLTAVGNSRGQPLWAILVMAWV
jgi:hypothetical protein